MKPNLPDIKPNSQTDQKIRYFLTSAMNCIGPSSDYKQIQYFLKKCYAEIVDPFSAEIDDFLSQKESQNNSNEEQKDEAVEEVMPGQEEEQSPAEELEEKVEDEGSAVPELEEKETLQDDMEEKLVEEKQESDEEKIEELEEQQDDAESEIDKLKEKNEQFIESQLSSIALAVKNKGYKKLAFDIMAVSKGSVVDILNELLMKEYQQRDIFLNYLYLFEENSPEKQYLMEHLKSERGRIGQLQRLIVDLGGVPTLNRLTIPPINPATCEAVIAVNKELEKQGMADYIAAAESLDAIPEYMSLKAWLTNVAIEEQQDAVEFQALEDKKKLAPEGDNDGSTPEDQ